MAYSKKPKNIVSLLASAYCGLIILVLSTPSLSQSLTQPPQSISSKETVIHAALVDTLPWSYFENNIKVGIDYDILQLISKELDIKLNVKLVPFRRKIALMSVEGVDLTSVAIPINEASIYPHKMQLNNPALYRLQFGPTVLKDQKINISSLADIYPLRVGILRIPKELEDATLPNHPNLTRYNSTLALLKGLLGKRIDAAYGTPSELWIDAKNLGVEDQIHMIITTGSLEVFFAWSTASTIGDNPELRHQFSLAIEKLRREGKIADVLQKYGRLEHFSDYGEELLK